MTRKLDATAVTRRSVLWLGTGLGVGVLVGCSSSSTATPAASLSGSASASTSAAAAGNTKLSAGTYAATFTSSQSGPGGGGGTQKLSGAYLVDGIAATIDGGTWASTTADQNVFLVVNGGSLTMTIDTKGAHCACVATDRGNGHDHDVRVGPHDLRHEHHVPRQRHRRDAHRDHVRLRDHHEGRHLVDGGLTCVA